MTASANACPITGSSARSGRITSNLAVLLRDFLREAAARDFAYGTHDCGLLVCDWVARLTGRDPAAELRGGYHDADSLRVVSGLGGWPLLLDRMLADAGLVRTNGPQLGDVVLILGADRQPRATIRTALGYVTVAEPRGLWSLRGEVQVMRAWTFS